MTLKYFQRNLCSKYEKYLQKRIFVEISDEISREIPGENNLRQTCSGISEEVLNDPKISL